jgi:hypothetical protein
MRTDIHIYDQSFEQNGYALFIGRTEYGIVIKLKQIFVYDTPQEALDQAHAVPFDGMG